MKLKCPPGEPGLQVECLWCAVGTDLPTEQVQITIKKLPDNYQKAISRLGLRGQEIMADV